MWETSASQKLSEPAGDFVGFVSTAIPGTMGRCIILATTRCNFEPIGVRRKPGPSSGKAVVGRKKIGS